MVRNQWAAFALLPSLLLFASCGGNGSGPSSGSSGSLAVSESSLAFGSSQGTLTSPPPVSVSVTNDGAGSLPFNASSDAAWLMVTPTSGSAPESIEVSVTVGTLAANSYTGHITLTSQAGQSSPVTITVTFIVAPPPSNAAFWSQMGATSEHTGGVNIAAQNLTEQLADIIYDPFVTEEQAENSNGFLSIHYPAPLTDGNDVYMMTKTGTYTSCSPAGAWKTGSACGPNTWSTEQWNEARFSWINGSLTQVWTFASDWKPEPNGSSLRGWEPIFHAVDANGFIYVPGAWGSIWKVNKADGSAAAQINPFAMMNVTASDTYVAGPLTADSSGNIYYNVIELADPSAGDPWQTDIQGAWLVKVTPADVASTLTFGSLVPSAPEGGAVTCPGQFSDPTTLPWPPNPTAVPAMVTCGSERPGINVAPAVGPDGTIYTASRAHLDAMQAYLIAVKPDFSGAKWVTSLQQLLNDGCGTIVPIATNASTPNTCRPGTTPGVDPTTNAPGSGVILDLASSSPAVLPDGSVLYGTQTNYNGTRGHMLKFDSNGNFLASYDFGWDVTPGIYPHNGTYSIILKDNNYPQPLYCNLSSSICQKSQAGPYYITELDSNMNIEWQFKSTNTQSCTRESNGSVTCTTTNPNGFEWCINMPAVDMNGNVYVTSEDGNVYELAQGGAGVVTTPAANLFLNQAIGAAYTPLSIGSTGLLYTQNAGHMYVVGN